MTKVYSYSRWSSARQGAGSTLERQEELAISFAERNNFELVTNYRDEGLSAFRGSNAEHGALFDFKEACKQGKIPKESWLVVESLDRITRSNLLIAQQLFLELMQYVNIHTCIDGKDYRMGSEHHVVLGNLMYSLLIFARAHEESLVKQMRTLAAAKSEIQKAQAGNYAIKAVGSNVWWVDDSTNEINPHKIYFPIAKEIVGLMLSGMGYIRITNHLNQKYPDKIWQGINKKGKIRTGWSSDLIKRVGKSKAIYGYKEIKLNGEIHKIENYYPPLCTKDEYYRIQTIKSNNRSTSTTKEYVPLLSGKRIFKCGHCNESMTSLRMRMIPRYMCLGGQAKTTTCNAWSVKGEWIDRGFFNACTQILSGFTQVEKNNQEIVEYANRINLINEKINAYEKIIDRTDKVEEVRDKLRKIEDLNNQKAEIESQLEAQLRTKVASDVAGSIDPSYWMIIDDEVLDIKKDELRHEFKNNMVKIVKLIKINKVKELYEVVVETIDSKVISFVVGDRYLRLNSIDDILKSEESAFAFAYRLFFYSHNCYDLIETPYYSMDCREYSKYPRLKLTAAYEWATINQMKKEPSQITDSEIRKVRNDSVMLVEALAERSQAFLRGDTSV